MSFNFSWPTFSPSFHEDAAKMLDAALNRGPKPKVIADDIRVEELGMGRIPPELEILEIGELSTDRFRGIFRLTYAGDAHLVLSTKVQANPLSKKPDPSFTDPSSTSTPSPFLSSRTTSTGLFPSSPSSSSSSRGILFAAAPLIVPMELRLSAVKLRAIVVLVVSKTKGITLVFKNDPLESLEVSSTFDSVAVIQKYLQQEIEGQLREMFREDLPGIIHRLSQRWLSGDNQRGKEKSKESTGSRDEGLPKSVSDPQNLGGENEKTPRARSKSRKSKGNNFSPSTSPRNQSNPTFNKKAPSNASTNHLNGSPKVKSKKSSSNVNPSHYTRPGHNSKAASTSFAKLNGELKSPLKKKGGFASFFGGGGNDEEESSTGGNQIQGLSSSYGHGSIFEGSESVFGDIENYDPTYGLRPDDLPVRGSGYSGLGKLNGLVSGGLGDLIGEKGMESGKGKGKGRLHDGVSGNGSNRGSNPSVRNGGRKTGKDEDELNGDISGSFGSSYSRRRNLNSRSAEKEREDSHQDANMKAGLDAIEVPGEPIGISGDVSSSSEEETEEEDTASGDEDDDDEEEDVQDLDALGHFDRSSNSISKPVNRYEDDVEDDYTSTANQDQEDQDIDYSRFGYPPPSAAFSDTALNDPINFGFGMSLRGNSNSGSVFGRSSAKTASNRGGLGSLFSTSQSNKAKSNYSSKAKSNHSRSFSNSSSRGKEKAPVEYETIKGVGGGTITRPRVYHIASRIQAPEIEADDFEDQDFEDESTRYGNNTTLRGGGSSVGHRESENATAKAMSRGSGSGNGNGESYGKRTGVEALDGWNRSLARPGIGDRSGSFNEHNPIDSRRLHQTSNRYGDDVEAYDPRSKREDFEQDGEEDEDPYGYGDDSYNHYKNQRLGGHSRQSTDDSDDLDSKPPSLATLDPEPMDVNSYDYKTQVYRERYGAAYRQGYGGGSKSSYVGSGSNDNSNSNSESGNYSFEKNTNQSTANTSLSPSSKYQSSSQTNSNPYPRSSTPNPASNPSNSQFNSKTFSSSPNQSQLQGQTQTRPSMSRDASAHFQDLLSSNQTLSPFTRNLESGFAVRSAPGSGHGYVGSSNHDSANGSSSPSKSYSNLSNHQSNWNRSSQSTSGSGTSSHGYPSKPPLNSSASSNNGKVPRRRTFQLGGDSSQKTPESLPTSPVKPDPIRRSSTASSRNTSLDQERGSAGSGDGGVSPSRARVGRGLSERGRWDGNSIRE